MLILVWPKVDLASVKVVMAGHLAILLHRGIILLPDVSRVLTPLVIGVKQKKRVAHL